MNNFGKLLLRKKMVNPWAFVNGKERLFGTLPSHIIVPMPSLSPTMESGSIAKWNVKIGDKFEAGTSLCDVETDKATVSFDATEEGFVAKILVSSGEIKVGQPLLVTVDSEADVSAFANFSVSNPPFPSATQNSAPSSPAVLVPTSSTGSTPVQIQAVAASTSTNNGSRIFASPLAKKLIREGSLSLDSVHAALKGLGSGFNGRIVASDVIHATDSIKMNNTAIISNPALTGTPSPIGAPTSISSILSSELSERQTLSKKTVPHYHVSMEIDMTGTLALREKLNSIAFAQKRKDDLSVGVTVMDFVAKAASNALKQVPEVNAAWMDTFVRKYEQVDINFIMGSGDQIAFPVIRAVESKGLGAISEQLLGYENRLFSPDKSVSTDFLNDTQVNSLGTFTIYNLGAFGVKSAGPIVLTPQACALAVGAITDTVVPNTKGVDGEKWRIAPIMVATITSDHRVVDGAIAAQWLSAFKTLLEKPETLLL